MKGEGKNMTLIIGLTGSIASGKSTISSMFADFHIPVIDADKLAREEVETGEKAYEEIIAVLGQEILQADKTLNRKKLGSIISADEQKRKTLNNIVHRSIRNEMIPRKDVYIEAG